MADTTSDAQRERILHGPLGLTVLRFGSPLALAMMFQVVFNLVDQYLIARLPADVSDASLDALGICDMVAALGTILSYGISTATATLVSQAHGRGDDDTAARIAWSSLGLVTLVGVGLGFIGIVGADVIVHALLGAKGEVRTLARGYLQVIVGGLVTNFLMFQITALQRALGQARQPLAVFVMGNVLNLFLAVLLVYGPGEAPTVFSWGPPIARALGLPRWEVVGAAWATVIARGVVCVAPFVALGSLFEVRRRKISVWPDMAMVKRIVSMAWPTSTQFVVRVGAVLTVIGLVHHEYTTAVNSDAGTAYALCLRMETMALFVSMGWGGAAQTLVGMCIGARMTERARRAGWWAAGFNAVTMALLAVAYRYGGEAFLRFFTSREAVVGLAMEYLRWVGPSYIFFGFAIVLGNAIVGAGAQRLALWVDAVLVLAVQLPLTYCVAAVFHARPTGLWQALVAANVVSAVVYLTVFRGSRWTRHAVVHAP